MDKPLYDSIRGLAPTISIEQKAACGNPRSTVGTITEIHDYLRVLWARVGRLTCHSCGRPGLPAVVAADRARDRRRCPRARSSCCWRPLVKERKGEHQDVLDRRARPASPACASTASVVSLEDDIRLDKKKKHTIDAVVDRLIAKRGHEASACTTRWRPRCATAQGIVIVAARGPARAGDVEHRACHDCGISFPEPRRSSSRSTRRRACAPSAPASARAWRWTPSSWSPTPTCPSTRARSSRWARWARARAGAPTSCARWRASAASTSTSPGSRCPRRTARCILYGTGDERVQVQVRGSWGAGAFRMQYEGAINSMMRRMRETQSEDMRAVLPEVPLATGPARPAAAGASAPRPWA